MRALLVAPLMLTVALAGCTTPDPTTDAVDVVDDALPMIEPTILDWQGHIVVGALDPPFGHDQPGEEIIWPYQQAGFNLELTEVPQEMELRVDWENPDAAFTLHPHRQLETDASGHTHYWGYHSETFTTSPGCIRFPVEDLAVATWPMMVHPALDAMETDYTLTVGFVGGAGEISDELHGHQMDGNYAVEAHEPQPCEFLLEMDGMGMGHSHA